MKTALPATDCLKWDGASLVGEGEQYPISIHEAIAILKFNSAKLNKNLTMNS